MYIECRGRQRQSSGRRHRERCRCDPRSSHRQTTNWNYLEVKERGETKGKRMRIRGLTPDTQTLTHVCDHRRGGDGESLTRAPDPCPLIRSAKSRWPRTRRRDTTRTAWITTPSTTRCSKTNCAPKP